MTLEIVAIALTLVAHLVGAGVLIWHLADGEVDWRSVLRPDDGDGGSRRRRPRRPRDPDGGAPLPDAAQSDVRLREPGASLADARPLPPRRPEHPPAQPERVPERA